MNKNKVRFGLKNAHYAKATFDEEGNVTYGTPKRIPGAVSLSLDAEGDIENFYADDIVYYVMNNNSGYQGDLELALIPEDFLKEILHENEDANVEFERFAFMFEFSADAKAIRHVLYCCTATRPNMEGETRKQQKEVKTETLTLTATPLVNGFVKAKTGANTSKSVYNNWYKAVYEPPVETAAKLAALTVGSLALSPAFDAEITEYTATTSNATNSITATGADGAAVAITVNGEAHESGESATWNVGENTVVIIVSKDGSESTVYTVTVTKSAGYRVNFFDGETLLLSQMLLYGRRYSYPERLTDGNRFVTHWMPKQFYSYTDIDLHAQWTDLLTDSWNEIIASAEDGTYKTKYSVGQYKMLDFGKYGIVPMRLTAFDTKQTPEGDTAKMLWCAYEPINTPIPFATNFPDVSLHYTFTQVVNATDGYRFNQSSSDYYQHISTSQFTITADEATDIRITSYTGLSSYAGFMLVYVNGEYFYAQNSADGDVTKTVHIGAGESITVTVINSAENQGTQNYGKLSSIIFNADVPLTITKAAEDPAWHHPYAEGNVYTYAESDLRGFLENSVYPELPAELKAAIKTVVNQQSAYSLAENKMFAQETQDRLWVPNVNELFNSNNHTYDGSSRLGAGMFTAINGFGMENVINTRTVSSRESAYKAGNNDPQSVSHGGQTARFNMPGKVFPCFAL